MSIKYNGGYIPAVGADGTTLVANSSASTGVSWQSAKTQNGFYNSALNVWQRGTTSASNANIYTADRWQKGAATSFTVSRQVTGDTTNLPFIQYCARIQRTSGSAVTSIIDFGQTLETTDSIKYAGKTVTLSFYARAGANYSATSNFLNVYIYTGTGTDQSIMSGLTGSAQSLSTAPVLTTTWQRFQVTGTIPSTATEVAFYAFYTPIGTAGTNDYYEITGVQLEYGSIATTYTPMSGTIQGELAACQRYYQVLGGTASNFIVAGYTAAGNNYRQFISFPVQMRIAPTMAVNGTWAVFNTGQPTAAFISNAGFAFTMAATATGQLFSNPDSSDDTITASAEL
jgi:hypothetical protein